jgi:hypothetical protein
MCQQWFSVVGQILDVIGFLTIAWEWHHMFSRDRRRRIAELEEARNRSMSAQLAVPHMPIDQDAAMWRVFQKLFLREWRWRGRVFGAGVVLIILGFLGQVLGSFPGGVPILGFKSC